ncbi:MAG: PQQ-binding-like beta-propeller repeat protein [Opitutales bacterium]
MNKAIFLFLFSCSSVFGALPEWPQFRGPTGQGHAEVRKAPVRWSVSENVAWRTELAGTAWSSPVFRAGKLYLTNAVPKGGDHSLRAVCLDASSGKVLWDNEIFRIRGSEAPRIHRKNSHASPTPMLDENFLYTHFGHQGTACLDLDGKVRWKKRIEYSPVHGAGSSATVEGGLLLFSADGAKSPFLIALDKRTGEVRWKVLRDANAKRKFSFSTPLVIEVKGQRQIISPASDYVFAYDLKGKPLWKLNYPGGYSVVPRPVFANGLVYVCSGFDRPVLHAIRPTGKGDVTKTHLAWKASKNAPHSSSVVVVGDLLFMAADNGVVSCLDAETGALHWRARVSGSCSSSLLHADERIYLVDESGKTFVFAAAAKYELFARNDLADRCLASFAATEGTFFIRTAKAVWRIGKQK